MWQTFDVGAVVQAIPTADASVVAGADGLDRQVRRARLASTAADLRRLDPNDFLVTSVAALLEASDDVAHLMARFDAAQIAGLALRLEPENPIPADLLTAADRVSLPVIAFARSSELGEVTATLLDALLDAQRQRLDHVLDIHQRFNRIMLAGGGAADVAATLHTLIGCTVAVVDSEGRQLVVAPSDRTIDLSARDLVRQPVRAGEHDYGSIVVDARAGDVADHELEAIERAAMAVAVRLAQASAVAEANERFAAISLEEIVSGHATDRADLLERAATFGWDLTRPRAVLLASIDPPERGTIPAAALTTIAAAARATLGRDAIVWTRSATIAALIAPDGDDALERRQIAESLRHELDARLRSVNVSIGVGRRVSSPDRLPESFAEASRAVDVGRWAKGRHVTEVFDQLGLERLLAATPTDTLAEFVHDAIGPLVAYDRANGTDLLSTLAIWLETRNMAEAARRLFVHYNTLKNRIERIEEILGPIVTDAARSLECEVAIYIDRHYDVAWRPPGA
jgi:purine catabolism regulator